MNEDPRHNLILSWGRIYKIFSFDEKGTSSTHRAGQKFVGLELLEDVGFGFTTVLKRARYGKGASWGKVQPTEESSTSAGKKLVGGTKPLTPLHAEGLGGEDAKRVSMSGFIARGQDDPGIARHFGPVEKGTQVKRLRPNKGD